MDKRRRKSLGIFRPQLSALTTIRDDVPPATALPVMILKKKDRKSAIARQDVPSSPISRVSSEASLEKKPSKSKIRPMSIFGSLNSYYSFDEERALLSASTNHTDEPPSPVPNDKNMIVLHHGEVQVAGSMFRKKTQYLVLTDTHLLRFRSQNKAADIFRDIPSGQGHISSASHNRISSIGSVTESQLQNDPHTAILLRNIVSVNKLDDGRPYFSIEVASYDDSSNTSSTTAIQLSDPRDSELWLSCLRAAVTKSRLVGESPYGQRAIEHAVRYLEADGDYFPSCFRMFMVTQRASRTGNRSSSEELHKLISNVSFLVIGLHKIHLVPLPRQKNGSSTSLSDSNGTSHGIASLSAVNLQPEDDCFHLTFRCPLQPSSTLYLASTSVNDIALCLRQAADYIRPLWIEQPFTWQVPKNLDENLLSVSTSEDEDHFSFDRTLTAYCMSYNVDPSKIRYTVEYDCEDAPKFTLLEPNNAKHTRYNAFELLAVLRALRYNESFHTISFRQIKLDTLHNVADRFGSEHFSWTSKSGQRLPLPRLDTTPLLVQELQCLALKNTRLRRVDFTDCITRCASDFHERDRGSGICEAIFPLCTLQLTNIDWVCLNGIALSFLDLEYIRAATARRSCHIRGLELSRCSLTADSLDYFLSNLQDQEDALECLDLSNNPARPSPGLLSVYLEDFTRIRDLNLSRFSLESSSEPILPATVLMQWKLEVLDLSGTALNTESVDSLAAYLMSSQSSTLRTLKLESCRLSGSDAATLLSSLVHDNEKPRDMHLYLTGNRLEKEHGQLIKAVSQSATPTQLTMQGLEYSKEKEFRNLLLALASNTTLQYLDISKVSIPYDASSKACEKLKFMFEHNQTLRELNISGEVAHLEAVTLGRGICEALRGLIKNKTLEILRIENQALGFPGAEALATVLESNSTLREIYCDNNKMGLQAFSMLVNAIKDNESLLWLAGMSKDRQWNRDKIEKEAEDYVNSNTSASSVSTKSGMRKVLNAVPGRSSSGRSIEKRSPSREQDLEAAMARIDDSWDIQMERLAGYLTRNYKKVHGLNLAELPAVTESRPSTAMASLKTVTMGLSLETTSHAEHDRPLIISCDDKQQGKRVMHVEVYDAEEEEASSDNGLMMA